MKGPQRPETMSLPQIVYKINHFMLTKIGCPDMIVFHEPTRESDGAAYHACA